MAANISSLSKGLVAHYPLNGEYETKDITPNGNHGTNNGATLSTGRKGEANGSYTFDGTNDYIVVPHKDYLNIDSTKELTYSFWLNLKSRTGTIALFVKRTNSTNGMLFFISSNNNIRVQCPSGGTLFSSNFYPQLNTWYKIDMIFTGSNTKLYVDGILQDTGIAMGTSTTTSDLYIGRNSLESDYFLDAEMSDVRIYNRALEEDEIKLLYDSFKPKSSTTDLNKGLVGHWMLDSENGAKDLTPNGNNGTANGGVTIGGTTDRKGRSGGATSFDGSDDKIQANILSNIPVGNEDRTLSAWIKQSSGGKGDMKPAIWIGSEYTHNITAIGVRTSTNKLGMTFWADELDSNITATIGEWFLLTGSYNGTTRLASLYINGILATSKTLRTDLTTTEYVSIGKEPLGTRAFSGSIQEARIYNRALSADEIKLLYNQYKPKEASVGSLNKGLVLDMPLTTKHMKSSTVVSDRTPNGNDGTVNGATVGSEYTSFDGVNDYVETQIIPYNIHNSINGDFTINYWLNGNATKGMTFCAESGGSGRFYNIIRSIGVLGVGIGSWYENYNVLNVSGWNNVIIIISGTTGYLYIDGILKVTETNITLNYPNTKLNIGGFSTYYSNADISNFKVYNRALSAEEVKLLYEKGRY